MSRNKPLKSSQTLGQNATQQQLMWQLHWLDHRCGRFKISGRPIYDGYDFKNKSEIVIMGKVESAIVLPVSVKGASSG